MPSRVWNTLSYPVRRHLLRNRTLTARSRYGPRFRFWVEDAGGRAIYKRGTYEPDLTSYLLVRLPPLLAGGGVVLDIGANVGWYSILIEKLLATPARIYAFEPEPDNFELLQENLRLNGCTRVVPVRLAASDAASVKTLYLYAGKNRGRHSMLPINDAGQVEVQAVALDALRDGMPVEVERADLGGAEGNMDLLWAGNGGP